MAFIDQILNSSLFGTNDKGSEPHYPYASLWINGREVCFNRIIEKKEACRSAFEESTFDFIREWLTGAGQFEVATSGSTGQPKVISLSRSQMIASAKQTARRLDLSKVKKALVCIDTQYIGGKMMLVRCFTSGMHITAVDPTANPLIKIPVNTCVEFTAFVPYQVNEVLESKHPHLLNNLDHLLVGGAPLAAATEEQLQRYQCACYETYGMTETVSHIALRLVNTKMKQQYFEALPGVELSLDERGCLKIKTDYLIEPVITNDIVEFVDKNKFLWRGRWDSVINTGGVKVMPEKIEKELQKIFNETGFSNRFFIAASPDERFGNKVVLVIEGVQFSSERLQRSLNVLKSAIPPFEFPKEVYTVPAFASAGNQKIDRNQTLPGASLLSSFN